jgi:hypothetical protein
MPTLFHRTARRAKPYVAFLPWDVHAKILIAAGLAYMGVGFTYVNAEPSHSREVALQFALRWFSIDVWGWFFVGIGLLAIISSRWPPVTKKWGYVLLTGLSSGWAATYALAVILGKAPAGNLSGAFIWADFAFMWVMISGVSPSSPKELVPTETKEHEDGRQ